MTRSWGTNLVDHCVTGWMETSTIIHLECGVWILGRVGVTLRSFTLGACVDFSIVW